MSSQVGRLRDAAARSRFDCHSKRARLCRVLCGPVYLLASHGHFFRSADDNSSVGGRSGTRMFAIFSKLQSSDVMEEIGDSLARTLNSFHLIQFAVHKEECDGYRGSVHVLAC